MGKKTAKVKVTAKSKSKAVKPTLGKGSGGMLTATIVATVNKNKQKK